MRTGKLQSFFLVVFLLIFSNSVAQDPIPLHDSNHSFGETDLEKKWFGKIDKIFEDLDFHGYLLEDDSLVNYVNEIIQKVQPSELKDFNIKGYILKSPSVNAGMFADGRLQIFTGALASYDNEAQLAYVICHEISHFIDRHSLRKFYHQKGNKGRSRNKVIANRNAQSEYSQNLEFFADSLGFEMFVAAGYKMSEAVKSLEKLPLSNEPIKIPKGIQRIFNLLPPLRTHPRSDDRISKMKSMILISKKNNKDLGIVNTERYQNLTKYLHDINLQVIRKAGNPSFKLIPIFDTLQASIIDTTSLYYKKITLSIGEICLEALSERNITGRIIAAKKREKRGLSPIITNQGEIEKAFKTAKPSLEKKCIRNLKPLLNDPQFRFRAHRALGLFYHQKNIKKKAIYHLNIYLSTDEKIKDKRYIKSILSELKQ